MEYAMLRTGDGAPVVHTEGLRSLARCKAALAAAGGRAPRDARGRPMVWENRLTVRGWTGRWKSRGLSLDAAITRQLEVEAMIQRDERRRPL